MHYILSRKAFTLIELLVVVLIIAILAAIALPQYQKAVLKSRFQRLIPVVKTIKEAQELYYNTNGTYTSSLDQLDIQINNMPDVTFSVLKNGEHFVAVNAIYKNSNFGYRIVLDHATGGVIKSNWKGKGFCIDYNLANDTTCTSKLGLKTTEVANWYRTWHMLPEGHL